MMSGDTNPYGVIFRYCDYYACFKGICPHCYNEICLDDIEPDSSGHFEAECPICGELIEGIAVWRVGNEFQ